MKLSNFFHGDGRKDSDGQKNDQRDRRDQDAGLHAVKGQVAPGQVEHARHASSAAAVIAGTVAAAAS